MQEQELPAIFYILWIFSEKIKIIYFLFWKIEVKNNPFGELHIFVFCREDIFHVSISLDKVMVS